MWKALVWKALVCEALVFKSLRHCAGQCGGSVGAVWEAVRASGFARLYSVIKV